MHVEEACVTGFGDLKLNYFTRKHRCTCIAMNLNLLMLFLTPDSGCSFACYTCLSSVSYLFSYNAFSQVSEYYTPKKIIHYIYCMKVPVRISIIDKFLILQFESSYKIIDRICIYMYAHKEYNSLWSLDLINLI